MRVAFDCTPERLSGAGVGTYSRELRHGLALQRDIDLLPIAHAATGSSSVLRRIGAGLAREAWYYPRGAERMALTAGAELLHVPASVPARTRTLPLVVTIHDAIPWRHPEWFTRANALQQRLLVERSAMHATRVITDSEASRGDLIDYLGLDPSRIDVIPLGVSPAFSPDHRDVDWLRHRFGVAGPVVLSVGTPEPRKNLTGTLAVFDAVRQEAPEATLLLVGGDGWRTEDLDSHIDRADGHIVRTGRLEFAELVRTYASADCFLFPSLREGFGLPPLEAMASGLPVVCSNRPSLPEVVGDAARTADPDDHAALARAVIDVLAHSGTAAAMREGGLERSRSFTWERTVKMSIASYRRCLERRP